MSNTFSSTRSDIYSNDSTVNPRSALLKNVVNNSLSRDIWSKLPSARKLSDNGDEGSCPILKINNTLSLLVPGWEGIPTNIAVNITLCLILLFVFYLLIRKVYQTERQINAEYVATENSSDWIHFIYGKRSTNHTILFTTKQINRENPNAYLPVILHKHQDLIKGNLEDLITSDTSDQPNLFDAKGMKNSHIGSGLETKSTGNKDGIKSFSSEPTLRSKSETFKVMDEDEQQQVKHLKSILFEEEFTQSWTHSSYDKSQTQSTQPTRSEYSYLFGSSKSLDNWLAKYFLIKDKDIYQRRGYDALQYLVFQRYLIYFLFCLTIICLFIILPLNVYAGKLKDIPNTYYRRTTIINVKNESPLIYVHSLMTIFVVAMGIFLMKNFSSLIGERVKSIDKKILLIENIPKLNRNPIQLKEFLLKKFPNVVIKRISFVFDVNQLSSLMLSLWTSIEAKSFCRTYQKRYGQRCEVRPYCLGKFRGVCGCCSCYPKVDGIEYYSLEKKDLEEQIDEQLSKTIKNPERMAFVVFERTRMAYEVRKHFKRKHCHCHSISKLLHLIFGHESDPFDSWQWQVSYAPYPDDIDWTDFATKKWKVWTLNITMNLLIIFVFLFISTPTSALNILQYFTGYKNSQESDYEINSDPLYSIFWSYIPTLGYTLMTSLLPAVIKTLTTQMPYRTKSDYNHSIMYKSYIFLVLMVLILPSLEIITVSQLFESEVNLNLTESKYQPKEVRWSCLFPAENGAFFLNYVLTSAFVGNTIEVMRISELVFYTLAILLFTRTSAEYLTARQKTKFEFYFGTYYPRILLLFTLIVTFSISSPLIAPIGLFYMSMKHLVDRYLIYHVYVPTKISQRIHSKAIVFVYFSLLFLLMQVYTHLAAMDYTIPSYIVGIAFILHFLFTIFELFCDFLFFL